MEYTVKKLAKLAGVTPRVIRHYTEIKLIEPARINSSGYRIYGEEQVDFLQQILFYKELGFGLIEIKEILSNPHFDKHLALQQHLENLSARRKQLDMLISTVEKTILHNEGRIIMSDTEKFKGLKKQLMDENEQKYGDEIRQKYGEDNINQSYQKFINMSEEDYNAMLKLSDDVIEEFIKAFKQGDPSSETAQNAADMHRQWLLYTWTSYCKEAHASITQMYVEDERFTQYYDQHQKGLSKFIRDSVAVYCSK